MKINLEYFKTDCKKHHEKHEIVLYKYLVLYLIRDVFKIEHLREILEAVKESILNKKD
jgi:hypothetical protein